MRRRDHEAVVAKLESVIERLEAQNADLLNRCMSKDWTQYTALSAEPQPPYDPGEWIFDSTGLVSVERSDDDG